MATQTTAKKSVTKKKPAARKVATKKATPKKVTKKPAKIPASNRKTVSVAIKAPATVGKKRLSKLKKPSLRKPTLSFGQLIGLLLVSGLALFAVSIGVWWHAIIMDPDRALKGMLQKSLSINGVTRVVDQEDPTGTMNQVVRMSFVPNATVLTTTTMNQDDGSGNTSTVVTEAIGTTSANYVRYTKIDTPGQQANYDNILDVWGHQDTVNDASAGSFLNDASISIVPMGKLNPEDRAKVLAVLNGKQVFSKYDSVRKEKKDGREVFVYSVKVNLSDLVESLAVYARATGIGDASQLNPAAYASAQPLSLDLTVDIWSRHLTSITYRDSDRQENYTGYGLRRLVAIPDQYVGLDVLQNRIQGIDQ